MMKKYMGYLPIGLLCLIVLFSQLLYTRHNDFHVELSMITRGGGRIDDPDTVKDLTYPSHIANTNLGGYGGEGGNA